MFLIIRTRLPFETDPCHGLDAVYTHSDASGSVIKAFCSFPGKEMSDSFATADDDGLHIFEGIVVNSPQLVDNYASRDVTQLIKSAMGEVAYGRLATFHGQFAGACYHPEQDEITVFTNQVNSLRVYYYQTPELFLAGTSIRLINRLLKANGIATDVDETAARMMLTYGYMLTDYTTIRQIRHLQAGQYIKCSANRMSVQSYHQFHNEIRHQNLDEALPRLEELFRRSVEAGFEKDRENNLNHIAFLSGGLDSRQTVMTAYNLGYRDITCLTFSEPGYYDDVVAAQICRKLGLKPIFHSLENGSYFLNINDNLIYTEGQVTLHGAPHLYDAITSLDLKGFGILHSGQIGDAILGSFLTEKRHSKPELRPGAYSLRLYNALESDIRYIADQYPNLEMLLMYNRAFNAATNGDAACAIRSWSVSPFLEPEFAQFGLNIDPALRCKVRCYRKWMLKYNRLGATYVWEKTGNSLVEPIWLSWFRTKARNGMYKVYRKVTGRPSKRNMIPIEYWWAVNPGLRTYYATLQEEKAGQLEKLSPELQRDVHAMFSSQEFNEKNLAYSLLAGLEYLYE